ncbi:50S ribosomal protein L16 [bacterium]|nr:50S ribosomal protein L16 [bacterium]
MLMPKKTKYRKSQKGRRRFRGKASRKIDISFGEYGLKAVETKWINSRQIEAARRVITRYLKKGGKLWIRIFPHHPVTVKSAETPMGGGKGSVDHYVAPVKTGTILFELRGIPEEKAKEAFRYASDKLPIKTRFVKK